MALVLWRRGGAVVPQNAAEAGQAVTEGTAGNGVPALPVATTSAAPQLAPVVSNEVVATRQIIAAHAPLRTRGVADPDSDANKKILETMVQKAISRAEEKDGRR